MDAEEILTLIIAKEKEMALIKEHTRAGYTSDTYGRLFHEVEELKLQLQLDEINMDNGVKHFFAQDDLGGVSWEELLESLKKSNEKHKAEPTQEMRTEIEKERKWLLKKFPSISIGSMTIITQFYTDGWRYRCETNTSKPFDTHKYYRLRKIRIGNGINQEVDIQQISFEDYSNNKANAEREISKRRWTYEYKGKKFEIDVFTDLTLIIMEVENVDLNEKFEMPKEIEDVIIMEVTGNHAFDNYQLAK